MREILQRAFNLFKKHVVVASAIWLIGSIVCFFVIAGLHKYVYRIIFVAEVASGNFDVTWVFISDACVTVLMWAVTLVAVIRSMVYDETGPDARRIGWARLPRTVPMGIVLLVPGALLVRSGNAAVGLPLLLVGQWFFFVCAVSISLGQSLFGIKHAWQAHSEEPSSTTGAVLVGNAAIGIAYFVNASIPALMYGSHPNKIDMSMVLVIPAVFVMNLVIASAWIALAVAMYQHTFGSPEEHYAVEDEKLRTQNMGRMQRSMPSYMREQGPQTLPEKAPTAISPNNVDPFAIPTQATPAVSSNVLYGGRVASTVAPGQTYGEWIGVSLAGELQLSLSWRDQYPLSVQVSTAQGEWLPVRVATTNPTTIPLNIGVGWHYVAITHGNQNPESRFAQVDWYLQPNSQTHAA